MHSCILCKKNLVSFYFKNEIYTYLHCKNCDLVFVRPEERLSPKEEKKRYEHHQNEPDDPDYRNFLSQLFEPLNKKLEASSYGLDYGSGPGPTLSIMFQEAGHHMEIFDPFFANNPAVLQNGYDFITVTETVEHFYHPKQDFERLWKLMNPGGYLGMMTLLRPTNRSFADWHYIKDDTHVSLYSEQTFQWIAEKLGAELSIIGERVIILKKSCK